MEIHLSEISFSDNTSELFTLPHTVLFNRSLMTGKELIKYNVIFLDEYLYLYVDVGIFHGTWKRVIGNNSSSDR